jgi:hypothetical protein
MGKIVIEGLGIVCCGDKIIPDPLFYLFIQFLRFYSSTLSMRARGVRVLLPSPSWERGRG